MLDVGSIELLFPLCLSLPSPIEVLHPSGQLGEEKDRTESGSETEGKISRVLLLSMKSFHYSDHLTFFGLGDPHPIPSHSAAPAAATINNLLLLPLLFPNTAANVTLYGFAIIYIGRILREREREREGRSRRNWISPPQMRPPRSGRFRPFRFRPPPRFGTPRLGIKVINLTFLSLAGSGAAGFFGPLSDCIRRQSGLISELPDREERKINGDPPSHFEER